MKKLEISIKASEKKDAEKDDIFGTGYEKYSQDVGAKGDDDITMLIVSYKLKCEAICEIKRSEFIDGWTIFA